MDQEESLSAPGRRTGPETVLDASPKNAEISSAFVDGDTRPDAPAAIDFLNRFFGSRARHLVAIQRDAGKVVGRLFDADEAGIAPWIIGHNAAHNLYYTPNEVKPAFRGKKPTKGDIARARVLHVDIDDPNARPHIEAFAPAPTCTVMTGGGFQCIWTLAAPIIDLPCAENVNKRIELALAADHCSNIDRLLRLPGTVNLPDERKRSKGRVPGLAYVVEELTDWSRRYCLEDFTHLADVAPNDARPPPNGHGSVAFDFNRLPRRLQNILLGMRNEDYNSRSEAVFAAVGGLIRENVVEVDIVAVLTDPRFKISEHVCDQKNPVQYARRQIDQYRRKGGSLESNSETQYVTIGGVLKRVTSFEELNSRFALLEAPGSASVFVSRVDFLPIKEDDLRRRLCADVVWIGIDSNAHGKYMPAAKFWMEHAHHHRYSRIDFTSKPVGDTTYNLFRGLGVTPKPGDCELIKTHIREVICAGDERNYDAMIKLLAWQLQNVGAPSRVIVALKTKKHQAGKGILLENVIARIYGPSGFIPSSAEQILGRFNDALVGRSFIFLDEVLFAGDRRAADAIKSLATCTRRGIETKGLPIVQCPIGVNLWLASNHDNAAHIEEEDARYWVLECSEHRVGDLAYFARLANGIESGGREAFAHELLMMDIASFVPFRDVPKDNAAKAAMIRESINPYDLRKWLEACCHSEQLLGWRSIEDQVDYDEWKASREYTFGSLLFAYGEWQKTLRVPVRPEPTKTGRVGEILRAVGFTRRQKRPDMLRYYKLPKASDCLAALGIDTPTVEGEGRNDEG